MSDKRVRKIQPLTQAEKEFAEENVNLVSTFSYKSGKLYMPTTEFEEIKSLSYLGYIKAIKLWFKRDDLRNKYTFATIAWRMMARELQHKIINETTQMRNEKDIPIIRLDSSQDESRTYHEKTAEECTDYNDIELMCILESVAHKLDKRDKTIIALLIKGYTKAEIGRLLNISRQAVDGRSKRIGQKLIGVMRYE